MRAPFSTALGRMRPPGRREKEWKDEGETMIPMDGEGAGERERGRGQRSSSLGVFVLFAQCRQKVLALADSKKNTFYEKN